MVDVFFNGVNSGLCPQLFVVFLAANWNPLKERGLLAMTRDAEMRIQMYRFAFCRRIMMFLCALRCMGMLCHWRDPFACALYLNKGRHRGRLFSCWNKQQTRHQQTNNHNNIIGGYIYIYTYYTHLCYYKTHMYIYMCICVCMYVHIYIYIYIYITLHIMYVCMYVCMHVCM